MPDTKKSKTQLIAELQAAKAQIAKYEKISDSKSHHPDLHSEPNFQSIFDLLVTPIFFKGVNRMYLGCNTSYEKFLGRTKSELIGKTVYDIAPKALADIYDNMDKRLLQEGGIQCYESRVRTHNGDVREVLFQKSLLHDNAGKVIGIVGEIIDITERKQAETALVQARDAVELAKAEWERTFDALPDLIALIDTNYKILRVNTAMKERLERPVEQIIGRHCYELMHEMTVPPSFCPHSKLLAGGIANNSEVFDAKTAATFNVTVTPLIDSVGQLLGSIHVMHNITEQKSNEALLIDLKEKAERSNRAKSAFLANMSHEIRTPLHGILSLLQLLENDQLTKEQSGFIKMAHESANRLLRLLNDILDISRIDAGKLIISKESFRPADLLSEAIGMFALNARAKGIALSYEISATIPQILVGDQARIMQILFNLIGNAVKFTSKGGVDVSLYALPPHDATSQITLLITVRDTGPGIADTEISRLFHPFTQADSTYTKNTRVQASA